MLHYFMTAARRIFAPYFCYSCNCILDYYQPLCATCYQYIAPVPSITMPLTSKISMRVFALGAYQEPLVSLIRAKYWSDMIASTILGELLAETIPWHIIACDMLVPIPLHWLRFAKRGYNQAHTIASVIERKHNKALVNVLTRTQHTSAQSSLSYHERQRNVHNIFTINNTSADYYQKHIVLIDDLMTTGATLRTAARTLLELKPASITAVVVCRKL